LSDEAGHDEELRRGGGGDEQADVGRENLRSIGRRTLRKDLVGGNAGLIDLGHGGNFEAAAADVEFGGVLALSGDVGDSDAGGPETLGDADLPSAADFGAGEWELGHNAAFGNLRAVVLALDGDLEAEGREGALGFGGAEAHQGWDGDFLSVNGEAHSGEAGDHGDGDEDEGEHGEAEGGFHGRESGGIIEEGSMVWWRPLGDKVDHFTTEAQRHREKSLLRSSL